MFLNIFFSFVETLESVTFTLCTSILLSNKKQPSKAKKSLVFIVNHIVMYLLSFVIYVPMGILLRTHFYEEHYFDSDLHPWTEVVYQNLESKNALFRIFDSTGSVFENSEKPLF